jgi:hypothetical protein
LLGRGVERLTRPCARRGGEWARVVEWACTGQARRKVTDELG